MPTHLPEREPDGNGAQRGSRLRLERLDASGLEAELELGGGDLHAMLGPVAGLRGELARDGARLEVTDAGATRCEVARLDLALGTVTVSGSGVVLVEVRGGFQRAAERVACELDAGAAEAGQLAVTAGGVAVTGRLALAAARLRIDGGDGSVQAERAVFSEVAVTVAGVRLAAERLEASQVIVAWGRGGLRVEAAAIEARGVRVARGEAPVSLDLLLDEASVRELAVHRDEVRAGRVVVTSGSLEAAAPPATEPTDAPAASPPATEPTGAPAASRPALLDSAWSLLDGVSGDLNVDLELDLTVPVLGRRRATHRFRIPIDRGTIDYMRLENDLSTLENALLDFSVRDGALVLERGIPLLPTRGLGKPIVRWDLGAEDLELARRERVRLAVLPRGRLAGEAEESSDEAPRRSRIALRHLELRDLDANLSLTTDDSAAAAERALAVRRIGTLAVAGQVFHDPDAEPREGALRGRLEDVLVGAMTLELGRRVVGIGLLQLALVPELEVSFLGLRPTRARAAFRDLAINGFRLAPAEPAS